jgi:hypothetical protein
VVGNNIPVRSKLANERAEEVVFIWRELPPTDPLGYSRWLGLLLKLSKELLKLGFRHAAPDGRLHQKFARGDFLKMYRRKRSTRLTTWLWC